eukprot:TRINITY_DN4421_c0_g1_i3.p1 TRINITY_DN4421_c0_g1~~TRINITY_DN4421_c0_g1_i3.p1  ORF type:complete len:241 (-),score=69.87 TRINITY_DN4421_c0_g1_i3:10-732(-)
MVQRLQTACKSCKGKGKVIKEKDRCKKCKGNKTVQEKKVIEAYIDKGMRHKQQTIFRGEGDQEPDSIPGDVIIILNELPHHTFKRKDEDLFIEKEISLFEALTGIQFTIEHLDGRKILIKTKDGAVIKPGDVKEIVGEGMPTHKRPFEKGNLYVKFDVKFPDSVEKDQIELLRNVLGGGKEQMEVEVESTEEKIQEMVLEDVGGSSKKSSSSGDRRKTSRRREAYDEDEDEGSRIDCAHQ